jgi:hypothetical protein
MREKIQEYFDSFHIGSMLGICISSNESDGIYAVKFFSTRYKYSTCEILLSVYDREADWKNEIRDMIMKSLAIITKDSQILKDRYKPLDDLLEGDL